MYTEVSNLFKTFSQCPVFGVESSNEDVSTGVEAVTVARVEDEVEIIDSGYEHMVSASTKSGKQKNYAMAGDAE